MTPGTGVIVAAVTPRGRRGELNFGAAFELIDQLCKAKVHGIAVLTAAGEYPAFSLEERTRLVYLGAKRTRVPLLAGVGSEALQTSVDLAQEAISAGAQGVLLPPPLLFPYAQEELREYYLQFATEIGGSVPVWIETGNSMTPDCARELMQTGRFAGVAGSNIVLSTEACAAPELFMALDCARRMGDRRREEALEAGVREFESRAHRLPPLIAVKIAMEMRGIQMGPLPVPVGPERHHLMDDFRRWFSSWLPAMRKTAANA
jgi:dihydrodipicolinate synthase/N-acetylneuraminate lyase